MGPVSRHARAALLLGAAALTASCAELDAWLTVPQKPLLAASLEKPKAILFFEQDGAMTPFLCGADGELARDKTCAGRVPVGARLEATSGERLLVEKAAYRDCGAGESIEVSPKPPLRAAGVWSADGKAKLELPRGPSALSNGEWQRLAPKLKVKATEDLRSEPDAVDVVGWVAGELDGVPGQDLLLAVEATPRGGATADAYRAVLIEAGTGERPMLPVALEMKKKEQPLELVAAVDLDGDDVLEVVTGGGVWNVSKAIGGKPKDIAAWYCYRPAPAAPAAPEASAALRP